MYRLVLVVFLLLKHPKIYKVSFLVGNAGKRLRKAELRRRRGKSGTVLYKCAKLQFLTDAMMPTITRCNEWVVLNSFMLMVPLH